MTTTPPITAPSGLVLSVPTDSWARAIGMVEGVRVVVWDCTGAAPDPAPQVVVPPYMGLPPLTQAFAALPDLRVVQLLTNGYDGVAGQLPDHVTLCNAAGVHDASTAELAVGLALASLRGLDDAVRAMPSGSWQAARRTSLADQRVLIIGWGGVGQQIAARLKPFEVQVSAVGSRPRTQDGVTVHGPDEISHLLPHHDIVILACPLTEQTEGLVDAGFLSAMPQGALLINVARGPVVRTDALLTELATGRVRAALDVTDPEPLPAGHPLWTAPGVLITPHVGGNTSAFRPRALRLLRSQLKRLMAGAEPANIVRPGVVPGAAAQASS